MKVILHLNFFGNMVLHFLSHDESYKANNEVPCGYTESMQVMTRNCLAWPQARSKDPNRM